MRDFFKQILSNLYIYCGNRQIEKMTDGEIKILLDSLERMSKIYSYIPEDKQKEIILTQLIADREYQNINVRTVSKWLEQNGKIFFSEVAHIPTEQLKPPLEGKAREEMLELWKTELAKVENNMYPDRRIGSGSRIKQHLDQVAPIPQEESALNQYCNEQASNEKGSEGVGEATEVSNGQSNTPEQNDSV